MKWKKKVIEPDYTPKTPEDNLFDYLDKDVTSDENRPGRYLVPCPIHNKTHQALAFDHEIGPQTWICMEEKPYKGGTLIEYKEFESNQAQTKD